MAGQLGSPQNESDLRPVTMADDDVVAYFDDPSDVHACLTRQRPLISNGAVRLITNQGVPAKGEHDEIGTCNGLHHRSRPVCRGTAAATRLCSTTRPANRVQKIVAAHFAPTRLFGMMWQQTVQSNPRDVANSLALVTNLRNIVAGKLK
jgi:hypothetical protein